MCIILLYSDSKQSRKFKKLRMNQTTRFKCYALNEDRDHVCFKPAVSEVHSVNKLNNQSHYCRNNITLLQMLSMMIWIQSEICKVLYVVSYIADIIRQRHLEFSRMRHPSLTPTCITFCWISSNCVRLLRCLQTSW